ncbi:hypothetical protein P7K49_030004 [Saguinus oedipus]|uniref:Uncharacterized protein n=1 Tax=Saguinus oedipus TaxID=9490 RepID=A0ABQ9U9N3_SAGOE|nr:hypothetical protein P7K49_030004 [Saguinus oedipus]
MDNRERSQTLKSSLTGHTLHVPHVLNLFQAYTCACLHANRHKNIHPHYELSKPDYPSQMLFMTLLLVITKKHKTGSFLTDTEGHAVVTGTAEQTTKELKHLSNKYAPEGMIPDPAFQGCPLVGPLQTIPRMRMEQKQTCPVLEFQAREEWLSPDSSSGTALHHTADALILEIIPLPEDLGATDWPEPELSNCSLNDIKPIAEAIAMGLARDDEHLN